jgi:hypothetical protein
MNLYQLENSVQDRAFLDRMIVRCKFAIPSRDVKTIAIGATLVVQLSDRRKFKGRIITSQFLSENNLAHGTFDIQRQ